MRSCEANIEAKIAVSSVDMKVDCVGACVGVRGSRIKNIVDELGGERIDIVRWNESLQVMIPNALQPAEIDEVFLYARLGRAIVLVKEDQLSLAIGRRGQNVRLASKLVGWDIEIMTVDEMNESIERAETWFTRIPNIADDLVEAFITEGFMSYDDITFMEPADMAEMGGISEEDAEAIILYAEEAAERIEHEKPEDAAPGGGKPWMAAPWPAKRRQTKASRRRRKRPRRSMAKGRLPRKPHRSTAKQPMRKSPSRMLSKTQSRKRKRARSRHNPPDPSTFFNRRANLPHLAKMQLS